MATALARIASRLLPAAIALGLCAPAADAAATPSSPSPVLRFDGAAVATQARPTKRPARQPKRNRAKKAQPLRPDRGGPVTRSPAKAKVATGDRARASTLGKGRIDPTTLPLDEQIARKIEELLRGPLRDGTTSLFVADAATGKPVFSVYPDDPLNPASNVKLISTAAALDILGPDFTYVTRILGATPDDQGVVATDLYLLGSYDPTLTRTSFAGLAQRLVESGVRRLDGDVVVGGTPTRDGIFRSWGEIVIVANPIAGLPPTATVSQPSDFIQIEITATTSKKKKVKQGLTVKSELVTDELGHQRMKISVAGQIGRAKTAVREIMIKERAQQAAHVLRGALRDAGVEVTGDVHIAELRDYVDASLTEGFIPVPLAEHRSLRFADLVARVNKRSTNWLADRLIVTAAARKYGGKPSMEKGIQAMYEWLEQHTGLDRSKVVVSNGSGLSYQTAFSARQVVTVLRSAMGLEGVTAARDAMLQEAYRASLAIGGKDGTIRSRFKTLKGTVHGKTGTLQRVVALAGVVEVEPGRQLVFSIITNGHHPKWKKRIRVAHEQLVGLLCDYLHRLPSLSGDGVETEAAPAHHEIDLDLALDTASDEVEIDDELGSEDDEDGEDEVEMTTPPAPSPADSPPPP